MAVKGALLKTENVKKMIVEEIYYTDTDFNLLEEPPLVNGKFNLIISFNLDVI